MSLSQDQVRALDQLRQRLSTLSNSLGTLKTDLERNEPLPTWPSLQNSSQLAAHNMAQLMATFESHKEFLKAAHTYPLTTFPGHTQEHMLGMLMRKKLEPRVEDWIDEYTKKSLAPQANGIQADSREPKDYWAGLKIEEWDDLWNSAGPVNAGIVGGFMENEDFEDDFTTTEREDGVENVATGLRRKLYEDSDEEEGDEDKMDEDGMPNEKTPQVSNGVLKRVDPTKPMIPLESMLRFMSTGEMPKIVQTNR